MRYLTILFLFASPTFAQDALVYRYGSHFPIQPSQNNQVLKFDFVAHDTWGLYDPIVGGFVVPEGASKVRLFAQVTFLQNPNGFRQVVIKKNMKPPDDYGWFPGFPAVTIPANSGTTTDVQAFSAIIEVKPRDWFIVEVFQNSGAVVEAAATKGTWFGIEIVK